MVGKPLKLLFMVSLVTALLACGAAALTIDDVQHSDAAANWKSSYEGSIVSVTGGVVTYADAPPGKANYRVVIQDPDGTEWCGIQMKVLGGTVNVEVGDRVNLTNVYVDEGAKARGNTYLIFHEGVYNSSFEVVANGDSILPTVVSPSVLGAGDESAVPAQAEKYEGMLLKVENVTVGAMGLGSHVDNYELTNAGGSCWAGDYMNVDIGVDYYHPYISIGAEFQSVTGILEQYTKPAYCWDYYQLLTRETSDLLIPEPGAGAIFLAAAWAVLLRRRRRRWTAAGARDAAVPLNGQALCPSLP